MNPTLTAADDLRTIRQDCCHCRRAVEYAVPADVAPSAFVECPTCLMKTAINTARISRRLSEDVRGLETPGPDRRAMLAEAVEGLRARGDDFHRAMGDFLATMQLPDPAAGPKGQRFPLGRIHVTLSAANTVPRVGGGSLWRDILDRHCAGFADERTDAATYAPTEADRLRGYRASPLGKSALMLESGQGSFFSSWAARPIQDTQLRQPLHGGNAGAVRVWTLRSGDDVDTLAFTDLDRVQAM